MSRPYNFLVAHLKKEGLAQLPAVSVSLREWFGQLGVAIERFGNNAGTARELIAYLLRTGDCLQ